MSIRLLDFWKKYEKEVIICLIITLVAVVSFRAGQTRVGSEGEMDISISLNKLEASNKRQEKVLAIADRLKSSGIDVGRMVMEEGLVLSNKNTKSVNNKGNENCAFIGSKNSDKYHLPSSYWAGKIKPENRVCFISREDAENKGYKLSKSSVKSN